MQRNEFRQKEEREERIKNKQIIFSNIEEFG